MQWIPVCGCDVNHWICSRRLWHATLGLSRLRILWLPLTKWKHNHVAPQLLLPACMPHTRLMAPLCPCCHILACLDLGRLPNKSTFHKWHEMQTSCKAIFSKKELWNIWRCFLPDRLRFFDTQCPEDVLFVHKAWIHSHHFDLKSYSNAVQIMLHKN